MKLSKEHILALKISALLLVFALLISYGVSYMNHQELWTWVWKYYKWTNYNRYIIFVILSFIIYFVSYFLAKLTIKPIEEHNEKLKEYNHNLAHELKTPISIVKSNLELFELSSDKSLLKSSFQELDFMSKIIDSLLFLSNKNEVLISEKNDIIAIFKDNIKKISKADPLKAENITFNSSQKQLKVEWDEQLLNSLVRNLLENALKYKKKGSTIVIELTKSCFTIKNKVNKDFETEKINSLFDTFYQLDSSRNTSWFWLWLSIVKKVCDIHKFKIKLFVENDDFIVKVTF